MRDESQKFVQGPEAAASEAPRRRHGYRGYPNRKAGPAVHWGTGFAGVGALGGGSDALPRADVLTEKTESATRRKSS